MATELERLVVQLSADVKRYENALQKQIRQNTNFQASVRKMQRQTDVSAAAMGASFVRAGGAIAGALAGSAILNGFKNLSEAATRSENALRTAGVSASDLEKVYGELSKAAVQNGAPIEALISLYAEAARVQGDLGVTSQQLIDFSGNVALALRVSGKSAQEASGALLQLGQALGGGVVRAEEFNSILEGAPAIAQAAAAGLREAGGSVARLRSLVVDGEVSSKAFFDAFAAGSQTLRDRVAESVFTVDQATTNLQTALIGAVREFNSATGSGERFAGAINSVAQEIEAIEFDKLINGIKDAYSEWERFMASLGNAQVFKDLNETLGLTQDGLAINIDKTEALEEAAAIEREIETVQMLAERQTMFGLDNSEALAQIRTLRAELAQVQAQAAALPDTIAGIVVRDGKAEAVTDPSLLFAANGQMGGSKIRGGRRGGGSSPAVDGAVSLADYTVPGTKAASKRGGGGSQQSDFEREIEQMRRRTEALRVATEAQAQINPLIEDYGFAAERASAALALLQAAQDSGLPVAKEITDVTQLLSGQFDELSPKAREQAEAMLALANAQATAAAESERLRDKQGEVKSAFDDFKNTSKSVISGFITDMRNGVSATEALGNALSKIGDKLIDIGLDAILGGGKGGGGFLSSLFGLFFADGGLVGRDGAVRRFASGGMVRGPGGPRSDSVPAMLSNGEFVVNAAATQKALPLLEAINSGAVSRMARGGLVAARGYASGGLVTAGGGAIAQREAEPVRVVVDLQPSGEFDARVARTSRDVSVQVVRENNKTIPGAMSEFQRRRG